MQANNEKILVNRRKNIQTEFLKKGKLQIRLTGKTIDAARIGPSCYFSDTDIVEENAQIEPEFHAPWHRFIFSPTPPQ